MYKKIATVLLLMLFSILTYAEPSDSNTSLNTNQIERLIGAKGAWDTKENAFKVSMPRDDLSVVAQGVKITPSMGLTSWATFQQVNGHVKVIGDLTLLQDQVNFVMDTALANNLNVTALNNHFLWESPRIMFLHIEGMGDEKKLAQAVGAVFAQLKVVPSESGETINFDINPAKTTLDPQKIDAALNIKGTLKEGVYKAIIDKTSKMNAHDMGNTMGANAWAAFVGSDDNAMVDGNIAVYNKSELQAVIKALRAANISIVSIHQQMMNEQSAVIFLHYWGMGKTVDLAKGLRQTLDHTQIFSQ